MDWLSLRRRFLGGTPGSLGGRRRETRARWLVETFPDLAQMSVLDLGGRILTWQHAPVRPKHVHVVNMQPSRADVPEWAEFDLGDACALPPHIARRRYDLVFANSVIEHLGGHDRRQRFADSVHELSDAHWIQTPYRYFPIEPHWMAPGMQFLPVAARAQVARHWPLSFGRGRSREASVQAVLQVELLDSTQMRHYFPGSLIRTERVLSIPKSLIAYRTGRNDVLPSRTP